MSQTQPSAPAQRRGAILRCLARYAGSGLGAWLFACSANSPPAASVAPLAPEASQSPARAGLPAAVNATEPSSSTASSSTASSAPVAEVPAQNLPIVCSPSGERGASAREYNAMPASDASASLQYRYFVVEDCQGACQPRLMLPIARMPQQQRALDDAWQRLVRWNEVHACSTQWLRFDVNYDTHDLLSVTFERLSLGEAFSTEQRAYVNLDGRGERVTAAMVFRAGALPQVAQWVDERFARSRQAHLAARYWSDADDAALRAALADEQSLKFDVQGLDRFEVTQSDMVFEHSYPSILPELSDIAPPARVRISHRQLGLYLNPRGPLGWVLAQRSAAGANDGVPR